MDLPHWKLTDRGLFRCLSFASFTKLTEYLAELGPVADAMNHHPNLVVRKATYLEVCLLTHDQQRVTELDYDLANKMSDLYEMY